MIKDLVVKNRSYRRFFEDNRIERETLKELIDYARVTPSGANNQPLKYIMSNQEERNDLIFPTLSWAGYIKEWAGPEEGERPSAYIIILHDKDISNNYWCDPGIAAQTILLGATEKGLGGCILAAVDRKQLRKSLAIPEKYDILYVLAMGKPKEDVQLETVGPEGDIKYWRDKEEVHHVPKRSLDEIIVDLD